MLQVKQLSLTIKITILCLALLTLFACSMPILVDAPSERTKSIVGNQAGSAPGHKRGSLRIAIDEDGKAENFNNTPITSKTRYPEMYFRHYGVNPTIDTSVNKISTVSVDVDTASYSIAKGFLKSNRLPAPAAIRVEEFINTFNYHYRAPRTERFNFHAEAFPSPNRHGYHLLHIGLQAKKVSRWKRKPANLVYLIDVSGSMRGRKRLGLLKRSIRMLTKRLRPDDMISIIAFNTSARVILRPTPGTHTSTIIRAMDQLHAANSTNVEAGIKLAYQVANRHYKNYSTNRIILISDGVANEGLTTARDIYDTIYQGNKKGIQLNTVGIGMGNYNDVLLEKLAKKGQGMYAYINDMRDARKLFVKQLSGTLELLARDVKLQIKFNPHRVVRYRLLGYENRMLSKRDFRNDRKDAGEVGAGHSVTSIYEVKLRTHQHGPAYFATMRLRYKHPKKEIVREISKQVPMKVVKSHYLQTSSYTRLAFIAAAFAEKLRQSYWVRNLSYYQLAQLYRQLSTRVRHTTEVTELGFLIKTAARLDKRDDKFAQRMPLSQMNFDQVPVLE